MKLELDDTQAELLRELLDLAYRDLRYEISNTDTSRYRAELRTREGVLKEVLAELGGPLPDPT